MISQDLSDKFLIFLIFWPVLAIFQPFWPILVKKWPKWAKKIIQSKICPTDLRNHYFAPLVQISGPENGLGSSYFHSSDFSEISFEVSVMENGHFSDGRRVISQQQIELFQFRKKRQLTLIILYHLCEN